MHANEVSKNMGEQHWIQSFVEQFIHKVVRCWGTHQAHFQTWTTTLNYFIEIFGRNKLKDLVI